MTHGMTSDPHWGGESNSHFVAQHAWTTDAANRTATKSTVGMTFPSSNSLTVLEVMLIAREVFGLIDPNFSFFKLDNAIVIWAIEI